MSRVTNAMEQTVALAKLLFTVKSATVNKKPLPGVYYGPNN